MPFAEPAEIEQLPLNDATIREAYVQHLRRLNERKYMGFAAYSEVEVVRGKARLDLLVTKPGQPLLSGIEIKSDCDSLSRLPDQVKYFGYVCTHMTLVVGQKLLASALKQVPDWWGVVLVAKNPDGSISVQQIRSPSENPKVKAMWVARMLWGMELRELLKALGASRGTSALPRNKLAEKLREVIPLSNLIGLVTQTMANRVDWRKDLLR